jgi:hypothetical protein
MPQLSLLLALLPVTLLGLPAVFAQEIFQWVDAEGRVIYGDQPPHDGEARTVEVQPGPSPEAAQAARARAEAAQRLADEIATERRRREAEAAAAAALRPAVPFHAEGAPRFVITPIMCTLAGAPAGPGHRGTRLQANTRDRPTSSQRPRKSSGHPGVRLNSPNRGAPPSSPST